ncbi:MAG TPA: hypothetical protein VE863_07885 [Pyrinomonadaceae bacterium]|jgi:hypothetical protein|nr:hypothetical protein [Pyrinomonadaceae bacterium]
MKSKFTNRSGWRAKLEKPQEPKVVRIPPKMSRFGKGTMLIPTPMLVDELIRRVPKGKLITGSQLRRKLAFDFATDVTCPLTTGIFVRIAAEAAEEDRANGKRRLTPYWRLIKDDGSLNPKYPGGVESQARYLRAEGLTVKHKGRKLPVVAEFEKRLYTIK